VAAVATATRAPDGRLVSVEPDAARELPFEDESFDVVVSSRALHEIPHAAGRELAVRQIVHGEPVRNVEALANPEALDQFRDRPELRE
jgi:SAM-dependent methyltransferase